MHFSIFSFYPTLAFLNLGPWEIALILFLALLLFGGKKLPGLAKDLGQGIREFRRSISGSPDEDTTPPQETSRQAAIDEDEIVSQKPKKTAKKASAKKKKKA
ncbi:MAG: twin-arginine translocase TatA/TatE family subunit [Leptospira sp.]|nr:twin-arginine translocase TatA/TatE family subunit [Leptospira sp.]